MPRVPRVRARRGALGVVVALGALLSGTPLAGAQSDKTPITRTVYGEAEPENAPGQSLTLQQVPEGIKGSAV